MGQTGDGVATKKRPSSNGRLTKDELLAKLRRREKEVEIDGGTVLVQGLTLDDFGAIRTMGASDEPEIADLFKKVCLLGCVDPAFDVDDLEALGESDLGMITLIANEIMGLSGMLGGGESAAGFLESIRSSRESSSTAPESSADSLAN